MKIGQFFFVVQVKKKKVFLFHCLESQFTINIQPFTIYVLTIHVKCVHIRSEFNSCLFILFSLQTFRPQSATLYLPLVVACEMKNVYPTAM